MTRRRLVLYNINTMARDLMLLMSEAVCVQYVEQYFSAANRNGYAGTFVCAAVLSPVAELMCLRC